MDIDPQVKKRIQYWLEGDFDEKTKCQVLDLLEHDREGLIDAFYTTLSFGTGGLRGIMGPGSNRINIYTVAWATQGLINYLKKQFSEKNGLRVAIGYDSRHQSKEFAHETARVLAGNGITALLFPTLCPTPLVSFACRYHHCQAAIMITASHNPPTYNGYKVYWSDGAQVLPPHDRAIIEEVNLVQDLESVHVADPTDPLIVAITKEVDEAYLDAISRLQLWPLEKEHRQL
ncbi:MAG: phospho-sugar mutase, partial [Verrucomicrobia bacterium]|nr:phospho-sugar mutase [Verrucomicrobiota bacterium]